MRKIALEYSAVAALLAAVSLSSPAQASLAVGINGDIALAGFSFGKLTDPAIHYSIGAHWLILDERLGIGLIAGREAFSSTDDSFSVALNSFIASGQFFLLTGGLRPFVGLGVGLNYLLAEAGGSSEGKAVPVLFPNAGLRMSVFGPLAIEARVGAEWVPTGFKFGDKFDTDQLTAWRAGLGASFTF
jgi:hypothetical protein